jgi:pyruvate/2-oxoglutarate dehydrogenase complex dihydrolipoamide acyltransferase (E2) component
MSHDVIMPALGMAQDSGILVSWSKQPGDAIAVGDALFEVETDKATMEVDAQHSGFLTNVVANAGDEVPVGQVIAVIAEAPNAVAPQEVSQDDALPEGQAVIMPALGMTQDTGLLVNWLKQPGEAVRADDILFEVETDKSTMEVTAGFDGFVAALLAQAGEDVPVGHNVAIISLAKPDAPVQRSNRAVTYEVALSAPAVVTSDQPKSAKKAVAVPNSGRILASPKARRMAHERGLDLQQLVQAGHVQPFHMSDVDVLEGMVSSTVATFAATALRRLTAQVRAEQFSEIMSLVSAQPTGREAGAVVAGLAAGAWEQGQQDIVIAYRQFATTQQFTNPHHIGLGKARADDEGAPAQLLIHDLRNSAITSIENCADGQPTLTLLSQGDFLALTLECRSDHMSADVALSFLTEFAGRMEQPLRHLL